MLRPTSRLKSIRGALAFASTLAIALVASPAAAAPEKLALLDQRLELSGVPIEILSPDLDGDGLRDLAIVVGSTSWGETAIEEETRLDEGGTFVDVLTVVPILLDRRELLWFRGRPEGGFDASPKRLEIPPAAHAIAAGPAAAPLVAWTDDGLSQLVVTAEGELELVSRIAAASLLTGSRSYVPRSGLARDLDGDGEVELLVPVERGLAVYRGSPSGLDGSPAAVLEPPTDFGPPPEPRVRKGREREDEEEAEEDEERRREASRRASREIVLPQSVDLDGDRRLDLVYRDPAGSGRLRARRNLGGVDFGPPFDPLAGAELAGAGSSGADQEGGDAAREVVWIGDLDGAAGAELVTSEEIRNEKDTVRAELDEARRPKARVRVHALDGRGIWDPAARSTFEIEGYAFEGGGSDEDEDGDGDGFEFELPTGVRDLDGDGRLDIVAIRLDFSLFEAMRVLTTHSIKIGLDFGIYRQGAGMKFAPVPGLDLSGELKLRLDDVSIGQLSSFGGDFDGDGRADFVQLGRGRKVTIHRGADGAQYAPKADLAVTLEREPEDVALVRVADFDGDGRSDLAVTQPIQGGQIGARAALELHLSRGAR